MKKSILLAFSLHVSMLFSAYSASLGTWYERDPGAEESIMGIAFGNKTWVIVGTNGYIASSTDGKKWKKHSAGIKRTFNGVTFQNGRFIAVCKAPNEGSGAKIWISDSNGSSWKYRDTDKDGDYLSEGLHAVAGNGSSMLVAVGGGWSGKMTISQDNGTSWNVKTLEGVSKLYGVAYGNNTWIACGAGEPIRSLDQGNTWQKIAGGPNGTSVAYGNGTFVMASSNGLYWSNDRGVTWKPCVPSKEFESDFFGTGRGVAFGDGYFAAAFENNGIWMSQTGIAWERWTAPGNNPYYYCMGFGNRTFMAGGDQSVGGKYPAILAESPPWFRAKSGSTKDYPYTVFDFEDSLPKKIGLPEYRVNTSSLNLILEATLFHMRTLGTPVSMKIVYCSSPVANGDPSIGLFGKNWHFKYETVVRQLGPEAQLITAGGRSLVFTTPDGQDLDSATPENPIALVPPAGIFDTLIFYGPGEYFEYFEKNTKLTYKYAVAIDYIWHLTSISDRNGNELTINVDKTNGQITSISDPSGRTVTLSYDNQKKLCAGFTVPDGRTVSFSYDENKNLTGITDMAGYHGEYKYDDLGFMTHMITDGRKNTFTYADRPGYNEKDEKLKKQPNEGDKILTSVTNYLGKTTSYELLEDDGGVQRTDPLGNKTVFQSNDGQTEKTKDPLGKIRSIEYNSMKLPGAYNDGKGKQIKFEYDDFGNVTKATDALGNSILYTYDDSSNVISMTDTLGNKWSYAYDAKSRLISATTPLGNTTQMSYSPKGRLLKFTNPLNFSSYFTYDIYGNLVSATDPTGAMISYTYDSKGLRCVSITDQRGKVKSITYDNNDRLIKTCYESVEGKPCKINQFNAFGQIKYTDELGKLTNIKRNEFGFITSVTDPMGYSSTTEYDPNNNPIKWVDPLGNINSQTYDQDNRPLVFTDAMGGTIKRSYDADGNLISLEDCLGNKTQYEYDANNRLIKMTDPLGRVFSYKRDKLGRIEIATNARGQEIKYVYDEDGRTTEKLFKEKDANNFVRDSAFTYDAAGNVVSQIDQWGQYFFSYDAVNRLTSIQYPDSKTLSFAYDNAGNVITVTYPGGLSVTYSYDDFNRTSIPVIFRNAPGSELVGSAEKKNAPISISIKIDNVESAYLAFQYNAAANIIGITRSNTVATEFAYNDNRWVTVIDHKNHLGHSLVKNTYSYNALGNIIDDGISGSAVIQPLLPESLKISYDKANQMKKLGKSLCKYDADGNLESLSDNSFSATYNPEEKPIIISRTIGDTTVKATYTYDSSGKLVKKKIQGGAETTYHYDNRGLLIFTADGAGNVQKCYIYANSLLVAEFDSLSKTCSFFHSDRLGNVSAITDAGGTVSAKYAYLPFGAVNSEGRTDNIFTFCGAVGIIDEGDGLFYMKNRFYDVASGRFIQRDPIGFEGGINLYSYAKNNPANMNDPNGLQPLPPVPGVDPASGMGQIYARQVFTEEALFSDKVYTGMNRFQKGGLREAFNKVTTTGAQGATTAAETTVATTVETQVAKKATQTLGQRAMGWLRWGAKGALKAGTKALVVVNIWSMTGLTLGMAGEMTGSENVEAVGMSMCAFMDPDGLKTAYNYYFGPGENQAEPQQQEEEE